MPSPNPAANLGQKLAKKQSQDFKAKIAGWDAQGPDEVVVIRQDDGTKALAREKGAEVVTMGEDKENDGGRAGSPTKNGARAAARKTSRDVDIQKRAWVRRKSKPAVEATPEQEEEDEAATPKKRIVSDGHWRRDRLRREAATPDKDEEKERDTTPKPTTVRRSVVNVGLRVPTSIHDWVEYEQEPSRVRPVRRHSRSRSRSRGRNGEQRGSPDYESSGTKVFIKRRNRSRTVDPKGVSASESSYTAGSSLDKPSTATDITTPEGSPTKPHPPRPATAPRERLPSRPLKEPTRPKSPEDLRPTKPKTPQPPTPVPKVNGNPKIEGWLDNMPEDPFIAPSEPSLASEPLSVPRQRARRYDDSENSDHDRRRRSSARARRRTSPETVDESIDGSSTPSLRRTGARRDASSSTRDRSGRGPSGRGARLTSNRLSSIASIEPLKSRTPPAPGIRSIPEGSVLSRASDGDEPLPEGPGLKRRLTKHTDLISVLSRDDDHKVGRRSTRSRRLREDHTSIPDLMNEISTEELRYQRELRSLVDGVIPVLLSFVLAKKDSPRAGGSRQSSLQDSPSLQQPIYEMGVALERLKASHKRIPMHDANELLLWAQSTAKIYSEYLQTWRLGFENLVVNLAPAEEAEKVHGEGGSDNERVDVAYLLKRPLVRIKNLSRILQGISQMKPSALADDMTATYQKLVAEARKRSNDERARLEDEAAAAIDPTRARNPSNLTLLSAVSIDPARSVSARDYFDMELYHSSGQQLGCKVEIIRRDDPQARGGKGDVLFCEVSSSGRWLLFPPILGKYVTARKGDKSGETIVMIRGLLAGGSEWREIMSLQSSEEQSEEWIEMLGSDPMPPRLTRQSSFNTLRSPSRPHENRPPSPTESEVPIGERAKSSAPRWDGSDVNYNADERSPPKTPRHQPQRYRSTPSSPLAGVEYGNTPVERNAMERGPYGIKASNDSMRPAHARSYSEWPADFARSGHKTDERPVEEDERPRSSRPGLHRRTSSVPSSDMPTIPKLRREEELDREAQGYGQERPRSTPANVEEPGSAPPKMQKEADRSRDKASPTPRQGRGVSLGLRSGNLPSFAPAFLKNNRRSSSPLKHQYDPAESSGLSSDSGLSDDDDDESLTSHSSVDEGVSTIGDLADFGKTGPRPAIRHASKSMPDPPPDTLGPSDSPSQNPYRSVPPANNVSAKSIACIFAWADSGSWDSLHPEECQIVVTPGLIEAFDLAQANAAMSKAGDHTNPSPSSLGVRPLVALELTPLVPLRRGTALDISIRSPPTKNSLLRNGNNVMFRSRSPEECEKLYNLINRARIDNPTWLALQNARGPGAGGWGEAMDRRNAARPADAGSGPGPSWIKSLSRKGSSYRSKGARSASLAASQSSIGSVGTAMSAIKKFSTGSRIFNIAKSTIASKEGTRSTYSDSLDSGGGAATPVPFDPQMGTPVGVTGTKCRLYQREDSYKWRDMGAARLTIMLPPRPDPSIPADPTTVGLAKRVLIQGKSKGETLLDVTLAERCFERVGRTGIAVTIWEELVGPDGAVGLPAATGGVGGSRSRTYMIQMKSEREAAFSFSMVGKLRY